MQTPTGLVNSWLAERFFMPINLTQFNQPMLPYKKQKDGMRITQKGHQALNN
jgi:hypothetical protein